MTLKPEDIIREAELEIQHRTSDQLEKKAVEVANDMISKRYNVSLEKIAETSPLIKLAMESDTDIFNTKTFRLNTCIEKIAAPVGLGQQAGSFIKSMMANNGARNIAIGAGLGAGAGLVAGDKDKKFSSAIKGGLLGGLGGASVSAYKSLGTFGQSNRTKDLLSRYQNVASRTRTVSADPTNAVLGRTRSALTRMGEHAQEVAGKHTNLVASHIGDARSALALGQKDLYHQALDQGRSKLQSMTSNVQGQGLQGLVHQRDIEKTLKGGIFTRMRERLGDLVPGQGTTIGSKVSTMVGGTGKIRRLEEGLAKFQSGPLAQGHIANTEARLTKLHTNAADRAVKGFHEKETTALADRFKDPSKITDSVLDNAAQSASSRSAGPGVVKKFNFTPLGATAPNLAIPGQAGVGNPSFHQTFGASGRKAPAGLPKPPKPNAAPSGILQTHYS
jgi:hypothetical protein